jgi:hypothetical protein
VRGLSPRKSSLWYIVALLALVVSSSVACKRAKQNAAAVAPEKTTPMISVVAVNDPAAAPQMIRGFYGLEGNTWRWTMKRFEVALKPPPGAAQNGARLNLRFTIPEVISSRLGMITLNASINGLALAPETYPKAGDYVYTRDVPGSALKDDPVIASFTADKAIPPSSTDARELSLIAVSVGLDPRAPDSK